MHRPDLLSPLQARHASSGPIQSIRWDSPPLAARPSKPGGDFSTGTQRVIVPAVQTLRVRRRDRERVLRSAGSTPGGVRSPRQRVAPSGERASSQKPRSKSIPGGSISGGRSRGPILGSGWTSGCSPGLRGPPIVNGGWWFDARRSRPEGSPDRERLLGHAGRGLDVVDSEAFGLGSLPLTR